MDVPDEVIHKSLERAILFPNSSNIQLWEFYWIKSEEEKRKFQLLCLDQYADQLKNQVINQPDSCPMEGFDEFRVCRELNLPLSAEINMIIAVRRGTEKGVWG